MGYNDTYERKTVKNFKQKFMDDPQFAATVIILGAAAAAALLNGIAHVIGSSGYAVHAAKR